MIELNPDFQSIEIFKYFQGKQIGNPIQFTLRDYFSSFLKKYQKLKKLFKNSSFLAKNLLKFFEGEKAAKSFFFD